jgi:hypothetical protein
MRENMKMTNLQSLIRILSLLKEENKKKKTEEELEAELGL